MSDDNDTSDGKGGRGPSQGAKLREVAATMYRTFWATDGRLYGVAHHQPERALRHGKPSDLVKDICLAYLDLHGTWPNSSAQAEVTGWLEAVTRTTQPVPLRCHWTDGRIHLDVGDDAWTRLAIDGDGIHQVDGAELAFRRAPSTAQMPWPLPDAGDLDLLWTLVPVVPEDRPLVLALLITAWMAGTPQPIVLLTGPQDSGKTTTAQFLLSLIDPVTHQRGGSLPEREDEWKARVGQARVVFVDNTSHITPKVSDLLCRVATGGELTTRELFTNDGAHVSDLLVPVWLTSIDSGVLRGDLQSRMVPVELEALTPDRRVALSDLRRAQEDARPAITRGLMDLASDVLALLPSIDRAGLAHRMTDYCLVVRCIDKLLGTTGEARLATRSADLAEDVLEADPVALALMKLAGSEDGTGWAVADAKAAELTAGVTAARLLEMLDDAAPSFRGSGWPQTPRVLSGRLRAVAPVLRQAKGIEIEFRRSDKQRSIRVARP